MPTQTATATTSATVTGTRLRTAVLALYVSLASAFIMSVLPDMSKPLHPIPKPKPGINFQIPMPPDSAPLICRDTDLGINPLIKGLVTIENTKAGKIVASSTDFCVSNSVVKEFYCDNKPGLDPQSFVGLDFPCPNNMMCQTGACIVSTKDMAFAPQSTPTYDKGILKFSWGNYGNTSVKFLVGQVTYRIDYLDKNGVLLGSPVLIFAGDDGSGGVTYDPNMPGVGSVTLMPPLNATQLRITLDPNNLIAESNEANNTTLVVLPAPVLGALTVSLSPDSPTSSNYVFGSVDQYVARYSLAASNAEDITVRSLVLSATFWNKFGPATGVQNIRLVDADTGMTIGLAADFTNMVNGKQINNLNYLHISFSNLQLVVPKGTKKDVLVVLDFTTYLDTGFQTTGEMIYPTILASFDGTGNPGTEPIKAIGKTSGQFLPVTLNTNKPYCCNGSAIQAGTITLYRAKLTVAWAQDTPAGPASASVSQLIGKFVVTNLANAGNYSADVMLINMELTGSIPRATDNRVLAIYKDSLATTPLSSYIFNIGAFFEGRTIISEKQFTDVTIASGASKTFYVTLDTTDARISGARFGDTLSVRIPTEGIYWTDGVTTNIWMMAQDLPLLYKTFTY